MTTANTTHKVCMITGANAGIGKATALGLAKLGATVVLVCRDQDRSTAALDEIKRDSGNNDVHLLLADLSSQAQIRQLAQEFKAQFDRLHVLINNAGVIPRERRVSADGIELQFAVNYLAQFLLNHILLDSLKAGAPSRILNVTSQTHNRLTHFDFDDINMEKSYDRKHAYRRSKLAIIMHTYALASRLQDSGVTVNAVHPGVIATNLLDDYMGTPQELKWKTKQDWGTPKEAAEALVHLVTSPELEGVNGRYFEGKRETRSIDASYDRQAIDRLWELSAEMTRLS